MKKEKHGIDLKNGNLKVTPQRVAVLEALSNLNDHPTADKIKEYVVKNHPNIAVGTIYKTLETFVEKGFVKKVKTDEEQARAEAIEKRRQRTALFLDRFGTDLDPVIDQKRFQTGAYKGG